MTYDVNVYTTHIHTLTCNPLHVSETHLVPQPIRQEDFCAPHL